MIRYLKLANGKFSDTPKSKLGQNCWIDVFRPDDEEIKQIAKLTKIPEEDLRMPLDLEERPRIEQHRNYTFVIYRTPFRKEEEEEVELTTAPLGIYLTSKMIITIHYHQHSSINHIIERGFAKRPLDMKSNFLVELLNRITRRYSDILKRLGMEIDKLEDEVEKETKKVTVERISDVRKTLIYFHRALIANRAVLLLAFEKGIQYCDAVSKEWFKDLHTETIQLIEVSGTYRDILHTAVETYRATISHDLNVVIKILTAATIIFMIPTLIASIYGMNITLPFQNDPNAFEIVLIFILIAATATWTIFRWKKWI